MTSRAPMRPPAARSPSTAINQVFERQALYPQPLCRILCRILYRKVYIQIWAENGLNSW
ncbi:MAG: hypothetical protein RLZZ563_955 [Pseudomonadota bacterium]